MSASSVAGPTIPRSWTPIANRRDDSAQTSSATSFDPSANVADQTGVPTTPFLGKITSEVTDSIMVSLPNGMKVGMFHFGGGSSGFDAQMLASLEHLADNLSAYRTTVKGTNDERQPDAVSDDSNNDESSSDTPGMKALDMLHVDLPNGISVEIRHSSPTPDADGGRTAMSEMEKAMEELVGHFNGSAGSTDQGSTAANSTASQRALAAYADQVKQKDEAAMTAELGLSKSS